MAYDAYIVKYIRDVFKGPVRDNLISQKLVDDLVDRVLKIKTDDEVIMDRYSLDILNGKEDYTYEPITPKAQELLSLPYRVRSTLIMHDMGDSTCFPTKELFEFAMDNNETSIDIEDPDDTMTYTYIKRIRYTDRATCDLVIRPQSRYKPTGG